MLLYWDVLVDSIFDDLSHFFSEQRFKNLDQTDETSTEHHQRHNQKYSHIGVYQYPPFTLCLLLVCTALASGGDTNMWTIKMHTVHSFTPLGTLYTAAQFQV